tara:strand:- start:5644 stop:5925 length:282 start_codon:yes stop_codon:yes gene_type:complete
MKLLKSNYDNKGVINHLKSCFSIIESAGEQTTFTDTQSFFECDLSVKYRENQYSVSLTEKYCLWDWNPQPKILKFDNRTDAIKFILKELKIIR